LNIQQPFSDPLAMGQHYDRFLPLAVIGELRMNGCIPFESSHSPIHHIDRYIPVDRIILAQ